jgi:hypothetical protein
MKMKIAHTFSEIRETGCVEKTIENIFNIDFFALLYQAHMQRKMKP